MPEASTTALDPTEATLAGQIDALISNMAGDGQAGRTAVASESAGAERATPDGTPSASASRAAPEPLTADEVESLASQIDALVSEVEAAAGGPAQAARTGSTPSAAEAEAAASPKGALSSEAATDAAIDAAVQEAIASQVDPQAAPSAGAGASSPDAGPPSLAELMDGAVPAPSPVPAGADGGEPEPVAGPPAVDVAAVDLAGLDAQLAARASPVVEPAQAPVVPVAAVLPVTEEGARAAREAEERAAAESPGPAPFVAAGGAGSAAHTVQPHAPSLGARVSGAWASAMRAGRPALLRLAGVSATTLERSPKLARDTVGWIGLVTVFFACCMWAVVLFFRTIPTPEAYDVPSSVLEPGEPTPQGRPRPRAAEAHAPAADDHGGAAADDHGAAADHGAGGDDHSGGH